MATKILFKVTQEVSKAVYCITWLLVILVILLLVFGLSLLLLCFTVNKLNDDVNVQSYK